MVRNSAYGGTPDLTTLVNSELTTLNSFNELTTFHTHDSLEHSIDISFRIRMIRPSYFRFTVVERVIKQTLQNY